MTTTVERSEGNLVAVGNERLVLSEKQRMLMPYVLRGLTTAEIAKETTLNPRTLSSRFNAMFQANRIHSSSKIAWLWLNEEYALVPKLPEGNRFKSRDTYLLQTPVGMVSAKRVKGVWRDAVSLMTIPQKDVKSVHELESYQ